MFYNITCVRALYPDICSLSLKDLYRIDPKQCMKPSAPSSTPRPSISTPTNNEEQLNWIGYVEGGAITVRMYDKNYNPYSSDRENVGIKDPNDSIWKNSINDITEFRYIELSKDLYGTITAIFYTLTKKFSLLLGRNIQKIEILDDRDTVYFEIEDKIITNYSSKIKQEVIPGHTYTIKAKAYKIAGNYRIISISSLNMTEPVLANQLNPSFFNASIKYGGSVFLKNKTAKVNQGLTIRGRGIKYSKMNLNPVECVLNNASIKSSDGNINIQAGTYRLSVSSRDNTTELIVDDTKFYFRINDEKIELKNDSRVII